eukprot:CAMPEP_0184336152 /NCGR_PEP_ID=MMETSP1089-20130417/4554_1 /TAXON_ID=38269 ORGANISM="Gloeochaete wittrockiana, Strain SAG46.84" /NCGR_SAMPLE_ID=MMETSP1089 /ASSEMBLY_ACC=CAM_ASM_000445 /LENGTH=426 /DNA_ID=CAMNT_0026661101 /DNA_START=64 /DNA_END=1344 /DNA_ORIENTATION=+
MEDKHMEDSGHTQYDWSFLAYASSRPQPGRRDPSGRTDESYDGEANSFALDNRNHYMEPQRSLSIGSPKIDTISSPENSDSESIFAEQPSSNTQKKNRLSSEQLTVLQEHFRKNDRLDSQTKAYLAQKLKLAPKRIEVWFQNCRVRAKKKTTEERCSYFQKQCEKQSQIQKALEEDNKRLARENASLRQFLRALVMSSSSTSQTPASTQNTNTNSSNNPNSQLLPPSAASILAATLASSPLSPSSMPPLSSLPFDSSSLSPSSSGSGFPFAMPDISTDFFSAIAPALSNLPSLLFSPTSSSDDTPPTRSSSSTTASANQQSSERGSMGPPEYRRPHYNNSSTQGGGGGGNMSPSSEQRNFTNSNLPKGSSSSSSSPSSSASASHSEPGSFFIERRPSTQAYSPPADLTRLLDQFSSNKNHHQLQAN